jgi:hypothetical protein
MRITLFHDAPAAFRLTCLNVTLLPPHMVLIPSNSCSRSLATTHGTGTPFRPCGDSTNTFDLLDETDFAVHNRDHKRYAKSVMLSSFLLWRASWQFTETHLLFDQLSVASHHIGLNRKEVRSLPHSESFPTGNGARTPRGPFHHSTFS